MPTMQLPAARKHSSADKAFLVSRHSTISSQIPGRQLPAHRGVLINGEQVTMTGDQQET
ncbi:hypothetical protein ACIPTP_02865 [Pectobacterium versatile]|uniref:hypothetical protein n=1 Tax=Pectobacterium versatile TaxID=2488639 RepID=UPI003820BB1A